jgi:hypothetical protein
MAAATPRRLTDAQRAAVESNLGLVGWYAGRFRLRLRPDDLDELRQAAAVGLCEAVVRHDPAVAALSTFAVTVFRSARGKAGKAREPAETRDGRRIVPRSAFVADGDDFGCDIGADGTTPDHAPAVADRLDQADRIGKFLRLLGADARRLLAARLTVATGEPIRSWDDAARSLGWGKDLTKVVVGEIRLAARKAFGPACPEPRGAAGVKFDAAQADELVRLRDGLGLSFVELGRRFRCDKQTCRKLYGRHKRGEVVHLAGGGHARPAARRLDPAERHRRVAAALELVAGGQTHAAAGAAAGLSRTAVGNEAKRAGVGRRRGLPPGAEDDIAARLRAGEPHGDIAAATGCSRSTVGDVAAKHGLSRRGMTVGGVA